MKPESKSWRLGWTQLRRRWAHLTTGDDYARGDGFCRLPPRWLAVCINNHCNLKCRMCDVGLGDRSTMFWANFIGDAPQNMSEDLLQEILLAASAFRIPPKIALAATEPLIHLLDFVRSVSPLKPKRILISHLNFINSEIAAKHNQRHSGDLPVICSNLGTMHPGDFDTEAIWRGIQALNREARGRGSAQVHQTPKLGSKKEVDRYYKEPTRFVGDRCCTDPWNSMWIKTDGTVNPAHGRCYNFPVGHIPSEDLSSIWNSGRFVEFRQKLLRAGGALPACARCCGTIGKQAKQIRKE